MRAGKQFMYKQTLLKQQVFLLVFLQFSSWSSHVGLTVHSSSVDVFSVYSVQKYFAINMELFSKDLVLTAHVFNVSFIGSFTRTTLE